MRIRSEPTHWVVELVLWHYTVKLSGLNMNKRWVYTAAYHFIWSENFPSEKWSLNTFWSHSSFSAILKHLGSYTSKAMCLRTSMWYLACYTFIDLLLTSLECHLALNKHFNAFNENHINHRLIEREHLIEYAYWLIQRHADLLKKYFSLKVYKIVQMTLISNYFPHSSCPILLHSYFKLP